MKKLLFASLVVIAFAATAETPIGSDVATRDYEPARAAAELVKMYGYRCDSIDFFMRSDWDGAFHITCNNNRYSYVIKDVGGNYVVEVRQ